VQPQQAGRHASCAAVLCIRLLKTETLRACRTSRGRLAHCPAGNGAAGLRLAFGRASSVCQIKSLPKHSTTIKRNSSENSYNRKRAAMASTAALQFGQQLVDSLLPSTLAAGSQLVLSPLSVWFALLLLLSGAGVCAAAWQRERPDSIHSTHTRV
jgi:hypothetical protein